MEEGSTHPDQEEQGLAAATFPVEEDAFQDEEEPFVEEDARTEDDHRILLALLPVPHTPDGDTHEEVVALVEELEPFPAQEQIAVVRLLVAKCCCWAAALVQHQWVDLVARPKAGAVVADSYLGHC